MKVVVDPTSAQLGTGATLDYNDGVQQTGVLDRQPQRPAYLRLRPVLLVAARSYVSRRRLCSLAMGATADAFVTLIDAARQTDATVGDDLAPGLPPATVEQRLVAAGVEPHESLIDWFSHTNGDWAHSIVFNGRGIYSLGTAIDDYHESLELFDDYDDDETSFYQPNWFRLISEHPMVMIDTTTGEVLYVDLETQTALTAAASLAEWFIDQIDSIARPRDWGEMRHNFFKPGATKVDPRDAWALDGIAARMAEKSAPRRFRLTHAEIGSFPGNQGLELVQARLVFDRLISGGAPIEDVTEFVVAPPPPDARGHIIRMFIPRT